MPKGIVGSSPTRGAKGNPLASFHLPRRVQEVGAAADQGRQGYRQNENFFNNIPARQGGRGYYICWISSVGRAADL